MYRFFTKEEFTSNQINNILNLPSDIYYHMIKVLRFKSGDHFELVTHSESIFYCELINILKNKVSFKILKELNGQINELSSNVTIACGILKGNKSEQVIKYGTQLGANNFIFLNTDFSVSFLKKDKLSKKQVRLQTIAKNAAEQSHRLHIPNVYLLSSFDMLLNLSIKYDYKFVAYEKFMKKDFNFTLEKKLREINNDSHSSTIIFFGPEGGISKSEILKLDKFNFHRVSLGHRILRAEIAPLYFLSIFSFFNDNNH